MGEFNAALFGISYQPGARTASMGRWMYCAQLGPLSHRPGNPAATSAACCRTLGISPDVRPWIQTAPAVTRTWADAAPGTYPAKSINASASVRRRRLHLRSMRRITTIAGMLRMHVSAMMPVAVHMTHDKQDLPFFQSKLYGH